jgi:hypothetical protein
METKIFYANKAASEDEAVRYFIHACSYTDAGSFTMRISKADFEKFWTELPVTYWRSPEKTFMYFNGEDNPMTAPKQQQWIRDHNVGHTSMSCGDIIQVDDEFFITLATSFAKLEFTSQIDGGDQMSTKTLYAAQLRQMGEGK